MKVNLTPEEVTVKLKDIEIVFHKINSMTATELLLARQAMAEKPLILVRKLRAYLKEIKGLEDANGKKLGSDDLHRIPSSLIMDIYKAFLDEAALAGNSLIPDKEEAEEKNSEEPAPSGSETDSSTTQD